MIKFNKKAIMSLLLSGSIALSAYGCVRDVKDKHDENNATKLIAVEVTDTPVEKQTQYVNKRNEIIDLNTINLGYISCEANDYYTLYVGASIYYKQDWNITDEEISDRLLFVKAIARNDIFTLVELPNGEKGYVNNNLLIKNANLQNGEYEYVGQDSMLMYDAYLYDGNTGMYRTYLYENQPCHVIESNGEYSLIDLPNGDFGYVLNRVLENGYKVINGAAFVKVGTELYSDKQLTSLYRKSDDEMLYVQSMNNKYATVFEENGSTPLYVRSEALDDDFILVDLSDQRMNCYIDYQLTGSWGTRTGRDSSPTCTGAYDIDEKTTDWEFTTFPGSFAKHWMPISTETQQGIHDLIGDDEWNYGDESYHTNGSHGCVRVPREASQFVFDNYNIGDMVLVRK